MLNAIEDVASGRGWAVIAETATAGFIRRLADSHLPEMLSVHDPDATRRRLGGLTAPVGLGGAAWTTTDAHPITMDLRNQITALTDLLAEKRVGLLITLDEIHRQQTDELREFGTVLQHAFREGRDLTFAGAGLPSAVSDLLNDEVLTFLRRADRHMLGPVSLLEVARAIHEPIVANDRTVGVDALDTAARATRGYPFLIQLVGHHLWRQRPDRTEITGRDVELGVIAAQRRMGALVHAPSLADTSDVDRSYLLAMAGDDGPSRTAEIAHRLGVTVSYASQYRMRLIEAELIVPARRGEVDFLLPGLREYLRDHAAGDLARRRGS